MTNKQDESNKKGEVWLVGAGPGDPELLTRRAYRLMQEAEVILYDNLISDEMLALIPQGTERIYVGKQRNKHSMPQRELSMLIADLAAQGKRVLRLKGGDPFIFGRGGEELELLGERGIPFSVTPGVTAALGAAAAVGIPLTHRDYAQSCYFVTGHLQDGSMNLDWPVLARQRQTLVIYMGLLGIEQLCQQLIAHGMPTSTPAAVIEKATNPGQRLLTSTLDKLPKAVVAEALSPPTLIIIGEVVRLHEQLGQTG